MCLHVAGYGHCERIVHSVLLPKFIEHCNHPCSRLCAVLDKTLLVSKAVMCRRIYCSPFHMTFYVSWGELYFFKCFYFFSFSVPLLWQCDSCRSLQTVAPGIALLAMSWLPL